MYVQRTSWQLVSQLLGFLFVCFICLFCFTEIFRVLVDIYKIIGFLLLISTPHLGFIGDYQEGKWGLQNKQTNKSFQRLSDTKAAELRVPSPAMPSFLLSRSQWVSWLVQKEAGYKPTGERPAQRGFHFYRAVRLCPSKPGILKFFQIRQSLVCSAVCKFRSLCIVSLELQYTWILSVTVFNGVSVYSYPI